MSPSHRLEPVTACDPGLKSVLIIVQAARRIKDNAVIMWIDPARPEMSHSELLNGDNAIREGGLAFTEGTKAIANQVPELNNVRPVLTGIEREANVIATKPPRESHPDQRHTRIDELLNSLLTVQPTTEVTEAADATSFAMTLRVGSHAQAHLMSKMEASESQEAMNGSATRMTEMISITLTPSFEVG